MSHTPYQSVLQVALCREKNLYHNLYDTFNFWTALQKLICNVATTILWTRGLLAQFHIFQPTTLFYISNSKFDTLGQSSTNGLIITSNFKVLRVQLIHLPKYNKSCILWHSALNRNAYFPYVSHNRNSKRNKNLKNYSTALCVMLQASSVLHTVWLLSLSLTQQLRAYYRQHLTAASTREKVKVTLALLLVFNGQVFFFCSQVIVQHAPLDLTQT